MTSLIIVAQVVYAKLILFSYSHSVIYAVFSQVCVLKQAIYHSLIMFINFCSSKIPINGFVSSEFKIT